MFNRKTEKKLEEANSRIKQLEKKISDKEELEWEQIRKSDCEIDFVLMNAFSIERVLSNDEDRVPVTCIGYFIDRTLMEWYIFCNDEIHQKLVEKFRLSRKN